MGRRGFRASEGGHSVLFVLALLPILGSVFAVSACGRFASNEPALIAVLITGGGFWLLAAHLARRGAGNSRIVVAGAIAIRIVAWSGDAGFSDDAYRYLWEGEVVVEGASPYAAPPEDGSAGGHARASDLQRRYPVLWARVNHRQVRAAYPPLAQCVGAAVAAVCRRFDVAPETTGVRILRGIFGACDLLVLWPLAKLLGRARLPGALAVVWAWCPLPAIEFAGSGHLDSLGILLLLGALAAESSRASVEAKAADDTTLGLAPLLLLCAGILTKYLPAVALPWLLRGRRAIGRGVCVALFCAAWFAPLLFLRGGLHGLFSGLGEYAFRWESGSLVHRWIEPLFSRCFERDESWSDPRRLARAAEAILWLAIAWAVIRRERDSLRGTGALIGAWLVLSPTLHPWYLCWILPFLAFGSPTGTSRAWLWLILVAPLLYWPLAAWQRIGVWSEPAWLWPVVALPFFGLLVSAWFGDRRRGARLFRSIGEERDA